MAIFINTKNKVRQKNELISEEKSAKVNFR